MRRPAALLLCLTVVAGCSDGASSGAGPASSPAVVSAGAPAVTSSGASSGASSGTSTRTWTAPDATPVQYVLVVPPDRTPGTPGKVLLTFPPGGQDLDLSRRIVSDRWHDEAVARGWVVVSPAAPSTGLFYDPASAALVPGLLDDVARSWPPEGGRFDLAGVSNGGLSAFRVAEDHPERFRSLVVFPGTPPDASDTAALARLKGLGTAFFVGAEDSGWSAAAALTAMGNRVELTEVPGQGHIIETLTGKDLFDAVERVR